MINQKVLRARVWDEPFAIKKLAYSGYKIVQGSDNEDWEHIDIKIDYNGQLFVIDVKRKDKRNAKSNNFCFTYINGKGEYFPFSNNGYFFFIDELYYKCYIVQQKTFETLLNSKGIELKNPQTGKAKLIKVTDIANISLVILDCNKYDKQYLDAT